AMPVAPDLGMIGGQVGILARLGDHTDAVLAVSRNIGVAASAVIVVMLLLAVLRGRVEPITGMGTALGAVVLLGPVVHPWYLLWAAIPLAATRGLPRYRRAALAASAVLPPPVPPPRPRLPLRALPAPLA